MEEDVAAGSGADGLLSLTTPAPSTSAVCTDQASPPVSSISAVNDNDWDEEMVSFHVSLILDITHACHLLYIQIARQSFLLADQERRTEGAGRLHIVPPSATVTSGSGTELGTSDTGGPTFSKEQELPFAPGAGYNNEEEKRAPTSSVTSPALMLLGKDPKLTQLRLVNYNQFSFQLYFNL